MKIIDTIHEICVLYQKGDSIIALYKKRDTDNIAFCKEKKDIKSCVLEEFSTYRYLRKARCCFNKKESLHKKAMLLFKQYMLVGGMPQAVDAYLQGRYKTKVLSIFEQIPGFLSKHEKRIRLNRIANGSSIDQYDDTFFWLGNSMICNECFLTKDPNVGLSLNEERSSMKCYMGDTGLLVSHTFDENELSDGQLYQ